MSGSGVSLGFFLEDIDKETKENQSGLPLQPIPQKFNQTKKPFS
jgi:hypothetical protein